MIVTFGDKVYEFEYRVNSLCELERVSGLTIGKVLGLPQYTMFRYMVWAGVIADHKLTLDEAGDLVQDFLNMETGSVDALSTLIMDAIKECGFMEAQGKKKANLK